MSNEFISLPPKPRQMEIRRKQGSFDFAVEKQTERQGIGMGVLKDGTPFLNQRGLASLCGVENAHVGTISSQWDDVEQRPRISKIKDLLARRGIVLESPHLVLSVGASTMFAYSDDAALAILEYYAFEAGPNCKEEARTNFRLLAGNGLRNFIYDELGYHPGGDAGVPIVWQEYHDRVMVVGQVPAGYFSVFQEGASVIVALIRAGLEVGAHCVPDGSIGILWGKHWTDTQLAQEFGDRRQYAHHFPDYFPQAKSNPQPAHCYPEAALPDFRRWMREVYLPHKLPTYLASKVKQQQLPPSIVDLALLAFQPQT